MTRIGYNKDANLNIKKLFGGLFMAQITKDTIIADILDIARPIRRRCSFPSGCTAWRVPWPTARHWAKPARSTAWISTSFTSSCSSISRNKRQQSKSGGYPPLFSVTCRGNFRYGETTAMKQLRLSNRLRAVAGMVGQASGIVDVGTDHGVPAGLAGAGRHSPPACGHRHQGRGRFRGRGQQPRNSASRTASNSS